MVLYSDLTVRQEREEANEFSKLCGAVPTMRRSSLLLEHVVKTEAGGVRGGINTGAYSSQSRWKI